MSIKKMLIWKEREVGLGYGGTRHDLICSYDNDFWFGSVETIRYYSGEIAFEWYVLGVGYDLINDIIPYSKDRYSSLEEAKSKLLAEAERCGYGLIDEDLEPYI